jgi:hypothetical protein
LWSAWIAAPKGLLEKTSMKRFRSGKIAFILLTMGLGGGRLAVRDAEAYTVVTVGTGTANSVEDTLISFTTTYFNTTFFVNPFFPHTYQIKLWGLNPSFQPPQSVTIDTTTWATNIAAMQKISSDTYVYGFATGQDYQKNVDIGIGGTLGNLCSSATNFMLISATTNTWSQGTCLDTISTFLNQLFQLSLSTPTMIPPP